jgi:hypothetical protein
VHIYVCDVTKVVPAPPPPLPPPQLSVGKKKAEAVHHMLLNQREVG